MGNRIQLSVIIPVFNAAPYLRDAVTSALSQSETAEVLLVEDGSMDDSMQLCEELRSGDNRIRLLTHPDNAHLGASASRNLGIRNAQYSVIAFLDADDYYLPQRFANTAKVFDTHPDAQAVYETVSAAYTDEALREAHVSRTRKETTGLLRAVPPEALFSVLAVGKLGHVHLNGFAIRREALSADLLFDPMLKQCQDSDWLLRLARKCTIYGGPPEHIVAVRRVHPANRVLNTSERIYYQRKYLGKCIAQQFYGSRDRYANLYIVARYVGWQWGGILRRAGILSRLLISIATACYLIIHPVILFRLLTSTKNPEN